MPAGASSARGSEREHALARRLRVEEPVGFVRLLQAEAMRRAGVRAGTLRSAMKRAHSAWPTLEKVHEAWIVSCRRIMSWLMSKVVVLPSPTNATRPPGGRRCAPRPRAASGLPGAVHRGLRHLRRAVSSRSAATGSVSVALIDRLGAERAGERQPLGATSIAITRAPIARPSRVALSPTGPWPKTARVSRPETSEPLQRAVRGAGAARDRRAFLEGKRVREGHEREGRHAS